MFDLTALQNVVAVADTGSVTDAARTIRLSQPALSRQIQTLERDLGIAIFRRSAGRLSLTSAGTAFLPLARELLTHADAVRSAAGSLQQGRLHRLTIAAPPTTVADLIAPFLARLDASSPQIDVREGDPAEVYDHLDAGTDLVVSTHRPPSRYASHMIADLPVWAYVPRDHPWDARRSVTVHDLAEQPLLVLPVGFRPRQLLEIAAESGEIVLQDVTEVSSARVAQAHAAAGRGIAIVSDDARFDLHGLRITSNRQQLKLRLHAGWDSNHHAAGELAAIAGQLAAYCRHRYGIPGYNA